MIPSAEHRLRFETAEGVEFSYVLASPLVRGYAAMVDFLCVLALSSMMQSLLTLLGFVPRELTVALSILGGFLINVGYTILFEWRYRGQTWGKRMFRIRVMDSAGRRLSLHQIVLRNLLRTIDQLPFFYLVGGVLAGCTPQWQRLGDLVAGTVVVRELPALARHLPSVLREQDHGHNSLRRYPHLAKRLRQVLTPEEHRVARSALERRDELAPDARLALFASLASLMRGLVRFPPEVLEGATDEQFVRNVIDVIEDGA